MSRPHRTQRPGVPADAVVPGAVDEVEEREVVESDLAGIPL